MTIALVHSSSAQEGILVAHGDHFELVCEDNELISITHTILETANITQNVTSLVTYSMRGTIEGEIKTEGDPEIKQLDIRSTSKDGDTTLIVSFSAALAPLKFAKLKLFYKLSGVLRNENGTVRLRYTFNTDARFPPEIVVKLRKPLQFGKLIVENTVPSPNVFIEESHYYSLVYRVPLLTLGNTSMTSIDISYRNETDFDAIISWAILALCGWIIVAPLSILADRKFRLGRAKKGYSFEVFKDKEGKFRFRLKAANGEIVASSESYGTKRDCLRGIESVRTGVANAIAKDAFD